MNKAERDSAPTYIVGDVQAMENSSGPANPIAAHRLLRERRARLTTLGGLAGKVTDAGLKFVSIPIALRVLGTERYGLWLLVSSLLSWFAMSDFGLGPGLVNTLSHAWARNDRRLAKEIISTTYLVFGAITCVMTGCAILAGHYATGRSFLRIQQDPNLVSEAAVLVWVAGGIVAATSFFNLATYISNALQEGYRSHAAGMAASVGGLSGLILIAHVQRPTLAAFAAAVGIPPVLALLALTIHTFLIHRPDLRPTFSSVRISSLRLIWGDSWKLFASQLGDATVVWSGNVLVAQQLGAAEIPRFAISYSMMMFASWISIHFVLPLWPAYAEAKARGDWEWIPRAFRRGILISVSLMSALCIGYLILAVPLIKVWARAAPLPSTAFQVLICAWFLLYVWNRNWAILLNGLGKTWVRSSVTPLCAGVFLAIGSVAVSHFGILGVPIAGLASGAVEACATNMKGLACLRLLPTPVPVPEGEALIPAHTSAGM